MLISNGSADTNLSVWRQTVTVATNKVYAFSGWVASWGGCPTWVDTNAPAMRIIINGTQYGGSVQAQPRAGVWQSFTTLWNSGSSTEAVIEVRLQTTSGIGNDIALDDLSFESLTDIRILTTTSSVSDVAVADSGADAQKTSRLTTIAIYRSVDIEWQSVPNRVYQVQWASSIPSDTWFNLGSPTLARGPKTSVTDRMLMHDKRFYRVLCLE
jgi:hypothetical protein